MKFLICILSFTSFTFAFETYPYKTYERESLGTILYSIGAKRLWGDTGSVKKHQQINKLKIKHEFKDGEVLRIAKEDIRFKCNVELKGNYIIIKRALISKKDRINLLNNNPDCMDEKIVQTYPIQNPIKKIVNRKKYIEKKVEKIKHSTFSVTPPKQQKISISQTKLKREEVATVPYQRTYKLSYINSRASMNLKNETESIRTVQNSNMGFEFESTSAAKDKGMMGNLTLSMAAINQDNPNYSFDPIGQLGYELGYKFNDKLMLSILLNSSKSQYLNFNEEVTDLFLLESSVNFHYNTSFLKKLNKITFFAGGSQGDNDFRGVNSGLSSEIIIKNLSFGIYYQYRNLFNQDSDLTQNIFGLSLGHIF